MALRFCLRRIQRAGPLWRFRKGHLMNRLGFCLLLGLLVLCCAPFIGATSFLPTGESLSVEVTDYIIWNIRVPRVLVGFFAGASLGLAGMVFQALFRNPLATPYTLGVASGASFGITLSLWIGLEGLFVFQGALQLAGLTGALLATALVYGLSRNQQSLSTSSMLLAGVAITFFFSSMILFVQYVSDFTQSFQIIRWLMGGLEVVSFSSVIFLLAFFLFGATVVVRYIPELDILSTGDELSYARGVDVGRVKISLFLTISLLVGAVVSFTGPIGFIGMMIPHAARLLVGVRHAVLAPATLILSGAFLVACDTFARVIIAPAEIPVGVVTALLGGPFFLWVLISRRA